MLTKKKRDSKRFRRKRRIRKKVFGTPDRPRMSVYRSNQGIYVQLIDDLAGHTLASAGTNDRDGRDELTDLEKLEQSRAVGKMLAERALEKGIDSAVFDRNGFIYHGRVAAVAEGARDAGLQL